MRDGYYDKIFIMKMFAMLLVLPFAAFAARTTTVLPLEASGFADMEAVTNIALVVDHSRLDSMRFVVELDGSATNGVEVALGADSNQDGALSQEEAGVFFGYDCGEWFLRGDDAAEVVCAADGGRISREFVFQKRAFSPEWNIVRVTRRGLGDVAECVSFTEERQRFMLFVR